MEPKAATPIKNEGAGCQPAASSGTDALMIDDDDTVVASAERTIAAKLFPKTPFAELSPWITQAGRKISRTCDLFVEPQDCS